MDHVLRHKESPYLALVVVYVLKTEPDTKSDYLYSYRMLDGDSQDTKETYKYHENDLEIIRKPISKELELLLEESINEEEYEIASEIKRVLKDFE